MTPPTLTLSLDWPAPTAENPTATRLRGFTVPFDVGTIDALERATGHGVNQLAEHFRQLQLDSSTIRAGVLFRMLLGCLQRVDPAVTYEELCQAVKPAQLFKVAGGIGKPFGQLLRELAGDGTDADSDPTAGNGSGPGPLPSSDSAAPKPGDSGPAT